MKVFIFLSICISTAMCIRKPTREESSILRNELGPNNLVGGRPAKQSPDKKYFEFPWMVSLHFKGIFRCSSFLITPKVLMTAAHCVFVSRNGPEDPKSFKAYMGTVKRDGTDNEVTFKEIIVHEKYVSIHDYDICLIKLSKPVRLRYNIQPICLPTKDSVYENTTAQAMGWGSNSGYKYDSTKTLQTATEKIPTNFMCNSAYNRLYYRSDNYTQTHVTRRHVCAGGDGGKGICFGDSGGPLVALKETKPVAIGIASFISEYGCAHNGIPAVFTATAMYTDWIVENMGEDAKGLCFVNKTSTSIV